jgi:DNA-binding NtrC family response regulator
MEHGAFREDLYYRIQGAEIAAPPLRDRPDDLPLLVEHFFRKMCEAEQSPKRLAPDAMKKVLEYSWPGNIRELENEIRRLALLAPESTVGTALLSLQIREGVPARRVLVAGGHDDIVPLKELERRAVIHAVEKFEGQRLKAAEALGISRSTLYLKLREIGYRD